jgi:membrane protein DedA with SNARE-associated domain
MFDFILSSHGVLAYIIVFSMLLAGAVGIPAPEDLTLIAAGILSSLSQVNTLLMGVICYIGILTGDLIIYRIGWIAGPALFRKKWFRKHISTHRLQVIRTNLHRNTVFTILVARHLFYIRTATFLMCGAVRISFSRFLIIDAFAALITTPVMMGIGYVFAHNYEQILYYLDKVKFVLVAVGICVAALVVYRYKRQSN